MQGSCDTEKMGESEFIEEEEFNPEHLEDNFENDLEELDLD